MPDLQRLTRLFLFVFDWPGVGKWRSVGGSVMELMIPLAISNCPVFNIYLHRFKCIIGHLSISYCVVHSIILLFILSENNGYYHRDYVSNMSAAPSAGSL